MQFTLDSFMTLPETLSEFELVDLNRATATATYRSDDFEGLAPREQLFKKLDILQMRGVVLPE